MPAREGRPGGLLKRSLLLVSVLAAPGLCPAQEVVSTPPSASTPATSTTVGVPAAEVLGAAVPGAIEAIPGVTGPGSTGLSPAPAEYTRYGAAVGLGASDNVNLSSTDRKSQALAATNLFFDLIRNGSRLDLSALGNFSDIDYLEHAYGNQVLGRFDGMGNLTLWKNHLTWLVRDDYGDSQVDALTALTPSNLQRVNVASTGPDLTLQPTLSSFVGLQGLYSRYTYQDQPFDGQAETGSLTLGHRFSALSSISLVGEAEQEQFDNRKVNSNYQVREYYARYALQGARTAIDLQGGVDQTDDTGSWQSSPLVRLTITRNVSPHSTVSLSGGRNYSNAMAGFASLGGADAGGIPIGPVTQTTANALQTYGNGTWDFRHLRTTIDLFGGWERDAYDRQSQYDVTRDNVGLSLDRQLTPSLSANVSATANRSRYVSGFTYTAATVGGGLVYRPGQWVVIYCNFYHDLQRSSGAAAQGLGYDEDRVFIMIGYYPHSSGTAVPGAGGMGGGLP